MNLGVVVNPTKSRRQLDRFLDLAQQQLHARVTTYTSSSAADVVCQARQAAMSGHDILVSAGGDGTLLGVLNGSLGSALPLCILPLGTANDYARALGVSSIDDAVEALASGAQRLVDSATASYIDLAGQPATSCFCVTAGVGFTAAVAQAELHPLMSALKRYLGDLAFVLAAGKLVFTFAGSQAADLEIDGQPLRTSLSLMEICKVKAIGGMPLTPEASLDSGYFDVCLMGETSHFRRLQLLLSLQRSARHIHWPDIEYLGRGGAYNRWGLPGPRRLAVTASPPLPVHLNGDFVGHTPATFEIRPGALTVIAPVRQATLSLGE